MTVTFSDDPARFAQEKEDYLLACRQAGVLLNGGYLPEQPPSPKLIVNATETDIVEFGLALHAAEVYANEITQEAIMERLRGMFGLPLENWVQLGANIRRRGSLKFLDRLRNSLRDHNEEIEENGRANRRPRLH